MSTQCQLGTVSYEVEVKPGLIWKQHVDHIRERSERLDSSKSNVNTLCLCHWIIQALRIESKTFYQIRSVLTTLRKLQSIAPATLIEYIIHLIGPIPAPL